MILKNVKSYVLKSLLGCSVILNAWTALSAKTVDLLIVVDNSGSMGEEQYRLSQSIEYLLDQMDDIDLKINVITTESACSTDPRLPVNMPDGLYSIKYGDLLTLKQSLKPGTGGHYNEIGITMAMNNIGAKPYNLKNFGYPECKNLSDWTRKSQDPKAKLAVLFVSDENEYLPYPKYDRFLVVGRMLDVLIAKGYVPGKDARFYGLIWSPEIQKIPGNYDPCRPNQPGFVQKDLIDATDGLTGDICNPDYIGFLEKMGKDIRAMAGLALK